jgi:hypothetical protein
MSKSTKSKRMHRRNTRTRHGYALVLFVFLMWVFVGLAALVIDLGLVRLTQRQMQTAADSAALDALRFRDHFPVEWLNANPELAAEIESADVAGARPGPDSKQTRDDPEWQQWRERVVRYMASRRVRQSFGDAESTETTDDGNTLLVRLRRSAANPDTGGDALPSLFARASLGPGFSVQYTGSATAGIVPIGDKSDLFDRAVAVGPPIHGVRGYAPAAITLTAWNELPPGAFAAIPSTELRALPVGANVLYLGQSSPAEAATALIPEGAWYIPIVAGNVVIGFGFATVDASGQIRRHDAPTIASENATASFRAVSAQLSPEVLAAFESIDSPLVCPVLVRRNLGPTPN